MFDAFKRDVSLSAILGLWSYVNNVWPKQKSYDIEEGANNVKLLFLSKHFQDKLK